MGRPSRHTNDRAANLLADVVVRIIYFAATALIMYLAILRLCYRHDIPVTQWHYVAILVGALVVATVGPYLQRMESQRGRGSLDEVKRESRRDEE